MTKDKKMGQEQSKTWFKELKDMTAMEIFSLSPTAIIDKGNTAGIEDKAEGSTVALTDSEVCINKDAWSHDCLLYTSPSPRDEVLSRMPSSA